MFNKSRKKRIIKGFYIIVFWLMISVLAAISSFAKEMSPRDILEKADQARGNVKGLEWTIKLHSIENGRKQERTMKVKARDVNSLAEFTSPARVKGRKLVMIGRNMWFVKPGLKKPVPISPRQKLIGGASNGDIASTNYVGDYKIVDFIEDNVNGEPCFQLDLRAVDKKATYDRIKYWISKKRLVGVKAEFFAISGKKFKTATFEYKNSMKIEGKQVAFVSKMVITDAVVKENITTMHYRDVKIRKIPDSAFNLNLLTR